VAPRGKEGRAALAALYLGLKRTQCQLNIKRTCGLVWCTCCCASTSQKKKHADARPRDADADAPTPTRRRPLSFPRGHTSRILHVYARQRSSAASMPRWLACGRFPPGQGGSCRRAFSSLEGEEGRTRPKPTNGPRRRARAWRRRATFVHLCDRLEGGGDHHDSFFPLLLSSSHWHSCYRATLPKQQTSNGSTIR
jgi:hypothetical protein